MSDQNTEGSPVFQNVSFESDVTPEQYAAGLYRDTLLFIKGHCDANGVDPSIVLSEQELADATAFEEEASRVAAGSVDADEELADWFQGTNYDERQRMFPSYSKPVILPLLGRDYEAELPWGDIINDGPRMITIVGDTFKIRATDDIWQVPQSDDSTER